MGEEQKGDKLAPTPKREAAIDVAAALASAVPWIGGPVSQVLSGISVGWKMERVADVLKGLAADLQGFRDAAAEEYVQKDEFKELLEKTLRSAAEERSVEKRRTYQAFLKGTIQNPGQPYDEQIHILNVLEAIQADHVRVIRAIIQEPAGTFQNMGSQIATLSKRLPDVPRDRITDLVQQLNDQHITRLTALTTMMTGHGAEDLRRGLTPLGVRFVKFILS